MTTAKARWRIELFGGLRVGIGEKWVTHFRTRRAALLLARLALEVGPVSRDDLVEWLWPDSPFEVGRNRLSVALSALRRALEIPGTPAKLFVSNHDFVGLASEVVQTDVLEFQSLVKRAEVETDAVARARLLREALALWRGPLWNGEEFDWLREEAQRLNELLCEASISLGELDAAGAVEALRRAQKTTPAREDITRALMRVLVGTGRMGEARQAWKTLEKVLHTEWNRAPSAETRALAWRLLEAPAVSSNAPRIESLPLRSNRFFGRDSELEVLARWLARESDARLVTILGGGGHGKTRLALEAARRSAPLFDGEVYFVSLASQSDARRLLEVIGDTLRSPRVAGQHDLERVAGALGGRRVLLILDNFEHVISAAPDVERLLRRAPATVCIVTSRCLLELSGERELALSSLPLPAHTTDPAGDKPEAGVLEEWARNPAIRLFADRARTASPSFRLHTGNARAVARLCRALEGMPLAIELAAARSLALSPAQIEEHLSTHLDVLEGDTQTASAERHRSLRAALDWSYELLSPTGRRLFRHLSVFRGGWTLERASAICLISPREDKQAIVRAHEELRRHSLLEAEDSDGELRFRFLETVRLYASERAERHDKRKIRDDLGHRHAHEFARFAQSAARAGRGRKLREWSHLLESELPDLHSALQWSLERDGTLALRLAASLWWFWFSTSRFDEGRKMLKRALDASLGAPNDAGPSSAQSDGAEGINWRAEAQSGAGFLAWRQGDVAEAMQLCSQSSQLSRVTGDFPALSYSLIVLQMAAIVRGDFEAAQTMGDECLRLARESGDQHAEAFALHLLGSTAELRGDASAAWSLQEQSVALFEASGMPEGTGWALFNWGSAARRLGDYERAVALCAQGHAVFDSISSREGMAYCDLYMGLALCDAGQRERARPLLYASLKELFDLGALWGVAMALEGVAKNHFDSTVRRGVDATRLLSAAQLLRSHMGAPIPPVDKTSYEAFHKQLCITLSPLSFEAAWETGRALSLEQSVGAALALS